MDVNKSIIEGMVLENAFNEILNESLDNKKFKLSDLGRNGKDAAMFCTKICYNILLSKKEYEIIKPFVSGSVDKIFLDNKGKCKGYKILFTKCNGAESDEIKKTIKYFFIISTSFIFSRSIPYLLRNTRYRNTTIIYHTTTFSNCILAMIFRINLIRSAPARA